MLLPPAPMPTLQLIGTPALLVPGQAALPLERKDAALLAILALDGATARDTLASLLWPDVPLKTANTSLRQRVFRLRKRSGQDLVQTGDRLALMPPLAVEPALRAAQTAEVPVGDLLGSFSYSDCGQLADWVRVQREHWRARRRDALSHAAAQHEAQGELARAIELAQRLVAEEPLSEHAQRRLMRLHYLRGDRAAAVQAFEAFERLLKDELGTRPDRETIELLNTIEHAQPAALTRRAVVPASLRRPPRMIGRQAELAALDHAWAAERVFVLIGEAGLGKTRLLQEFMASHAHSVWVQARPGDSAVPFALLARLLRAVHDAAGDAALPADASTRGELSRVLPELGAGLVIAGEGQRLLLQRAIETLLAQALARGVGTLLVDDLHFADAASLEMLQGLVASERLAGWHWGLAQRPGEGGAAAEALMRALEETQRLQRVTLAPLDVAQMQALIESLALPEVDAAHWAAALVRHTGGNPLFALETMKDMVLAGVPARQPHNAALPQPVTVGALIERRLRQLSAPALALARVAAIAGVDFSIDLAEAVLKTPALALADAWSELESAQVLQGAAFAHDLVYDAALRTVPAEIARHTHAAVAEYLQAHGGEAARTAEHFDAAARWSDAARHFELAAQEARRRSRLPESLTLWERAVNAFERAHQRDARFMAELQRIDVMLASRGIAPARAVAAQLLEDAATDRERTLAEIAMAQVHLSAGEWVETIAVARRAVARAELLRQPALSIDGLRQIGIALSQTGRAKEAIAELRAAEPTTRALGSPRQHYELLTGLAYALNVEDQPAASADVLREAIAMADTHGDPAEVMASTSNLAITLVGLGRFEEAMRYARQSDAMAERLGEIEGLQASVNRMNLAVIAAQLGEFREALSLLERALTALRARGSALWVHTAENHFAAVWLVLGQAARAQPLLATTVPESMASTYARRQQLRSRSLRLSGQDGRGVLEAAIEATRSRLKPRMLYALELDLSRWLDPPHALPMIRAVRRRAEAHDEGAAMHALLREVDVLADLDPDRAAGLADELLRTSEITWATDAYRPELWLVAARAKRAAGLTSEADQLALRGRHWVEAVRGVHLDPPLHQGFIERNLVNRALWSWRVVDPEATRALTR